MQALVSGAKTAASTAAIVKRLRGKDLDIGFSKVRGAQRATLASPEECTTWRMFRMQVPLDLTQRRPAHGRFTPIEKDRRWTGLRRQAVSNLR